MKVFRNVIPYVRSKKSTLLDSLTFRSTQYVAHNYPVPFFNLIKDLSPNVAAVNFPGDYFVYFPHSL